MEPLVRKARRARPSRGTPSVIRSPGFPVTSIYRWDGAVHKATESRTFLRTVVGRVESLVAFVLEKNPYEVSGVTALPIVGGNPTYLKWIQRETTDSEAT